MPHPYKHAVISAFVIFACIIQATRAQSPQVSYLLDNTQSGSTKNYVARDEIVMKPGFVYSASGSNTFSAKIDAGLLFPPTENTYALPNGTITSDPTQGAVVGSIPGQFAVSPTGAATYTIPIECPTGINGMQPSVALVYNSQTGNGIAGWGWQLAGLSAISRTGSTLYHDEKIQPIKLDTSDNFALDGQRLILISGDSKWAQNAEFRTEIESYCKIIRKQVGSYLAFEVTTKEGTIFEYGSSDDTRLTGIGQNYPISFLLKKVTDPNGNYMTYTYYKDNGDWNTGEIFLEKISYGGNTVAGTSHSTEIYFQHGERADLQYSFINSAKIVTSRLLYSILIKDINSDETIRRYSLNYDVNEINSKLLNVSLHGNDGYSQHINPTGFTWDNTIETYNKLSYSFPAEVHSLLSKQFFYSDFNGDGITDILLFNINPDINNDEHQCTFSLYKASGANSYTCWTSVSTNILKSDEIINIIPGDFDGDGYYDFIFSYKRDVNGTPTYVHDLYKNSAENLDPSFSLNTYAYSENEAIIGDFDGDGKMDLIFENEHKIVRFFGDGTSLFSQNDITWGSKKHMEDFPNNKFTLDFNGDGKTDLYISDQDGFRIYTLEKTGYNENFVLIVDGTYPNVDTGVYFGDFNGDGKSDFLTQKISSNDTDIYYSTGTKFVKKSIDWLKQYNIKLFSGDYNGDGKSDIALFTANKVIFGISGGYNLIKKEYSSPDNFTPYLRNSISSRFYGDGREQLLINYENSVAQLSYGRDTETLNIKKIKDGIGQEIKIDYGFTNQSEVYSKENTHSYPIANYNSLMKLVRKYSNGFDAELFQTTMKYSDAKIHLLGKGFLGFTTVESVDDTHNIVNKTTYKYDSSNYYTYLFSQANLTTSNTTISTISYVNNSIPLGSKRIFPYIASQTNSDNLTGLTQTVSYLNYDNYGNPTTLSKSVGGLTETQTISYIQKGSWCPNKPQGISTVITYASQSETKQMEFDYDNNGNLTKEIINPNSTEYKVTTEYKNFNAFGQAQTIEVKAKDADGIERTRSSSMTYTSSGTSKGRFVTSKTNVLGETTTYDWNETRGLLNSETSQGKTTYYTYDDFGRLKETRYADGNRKTQVLQWAGGGGPNGAVYYSYAQASGSAPVTTWFDALGREIQKDTYGLNDRKISVSTEYYTSGANKGRPYRISEPYFEGDTKTWAQTYSVYDAYGRPTTVQTPMGNITTVYDGLSTTVTTPEATKTTTLNNSGFVASSTVNGKTVSYSYYPSGLTKTATPQGGQVLSMEYNLQGKRTKLTDPDAGVIETKHNGFGELVEEKQKVHSNNFLVTTHHFEPTTGQLDSINRNGEITSYSYDTQNRVNSIEITGQHKQIFSYDDFDRVTKIREEIGSNIYNRETAYDALGRVKKETFPSGYYTINHYDNDYGFLTEIKDKYGRQLWKVNSENARGQITEVQRAGITTNFGFDNRGLPSSIQANGIQHTVFNFNEKGNLVSKQDYLSEHAENYQYDALNRLKNWRVFFRDHLMKTDSITYDVITGTINQKSDIGNFEMYYGENGKPHALTSIEGVPVNFPADSLSVTYTDFKKIKTLTEGNKYYILTYGIDDQRRKSEYKINGVTQKTKYYLGDYEEETDNLGNIKKIHYLSGGAILINTNGVETLYYGYSDYQGNLIALANDAGTVVERYAYDPWGKRRNPSDWTQIDTRTSWIVSRGYTMHEHLDSFGIINMNGRVYDPLTAMFFSPDPFVQAPGNWLNYNRYGYAYGNPFKYTDPSGGFLVESIIIGAIMNGFMNGGLNWFYGGNFWNGFWKGAIIGGLSGLAGAGMGQLVSQSVGTIGFIGGGLTGAVGGLASGFVSGAGNAWINGASFEKGLMSGLKSAGSGAFAGGIIGGLSGGITSVSHGGDFWTGDGFTQDFVISPSASKSIKIPDDMEYSTKYAKKFSNENYNSIKKLDNLYADGRVPKRGGYRKDGDLVFNSKGFPVGGTTVYNGIGKGSDVFLYKSAFINKETLYLVMGHEYIHVNFNAKGYYKSVNAQDRAAYKWNIDQAKAWNMSTTYYKKMYDSYYIKHMSPVLKYDQAGFFILNVRPW